jgi:hypothetical protein
MESKRSVLFNSRGAVLRSVRRPRLRRALLPRPVIGEKDLTTQRVGGPINPPQKSFNTPITRKTRFNIAYAGTNVSFIISPAQIAANDAAEYFNSSTPLRFSTIQTTKCEAWFGTINDPTTAPYPNLDVTDSFSGVTFSDTPNGGVDWAHVAIRPCLSLRQDQLAVTSSQSLFVIGVPAAAGCSGNIVVDVTFTGQ